MLNDTPSQSTNALTSSGSHTSSTMTTFKVLNAEILKDQYDIPKKLIRVDLIPSNYETLDVAEQNDIINSAYLNISYKEGIPSLDNGTPLWKQFDYENDTYYTLFKLYLYNKYSEISAELDSYHQSDNYNALLSSENLEDYNTIPRSIALLKESTVFDTYELKPTELDAIYEYYYWEVRCRAFDKFMIVRERKLAEARILSTNNRHYNICDALLSRLNGYIFSEDFMSELTPQAALSAYDKIMKHQRLATGQGMQAGATRNLSVYSSDEAVLGAVQTQERNAMLYGNEESQQNRIGFDAIMQNPDQLRQAQELALFAINETQRNEDNANSRPSPQSTNADSNFRSKIINYIPEEEETKTNSATSQANPNPNSVAATTND